MGRVCSGEAADKGCSSPCFTLTGMADNANSLSVRTVVVEAAGSLSLSSTADAGTGLSSAVREVEGSYGRSKIISKCINFVRICMKS